MTQISEDLDVTSEFLESGKLKSKPKKRGGPYSKDEKNKRLDEVYRLHFEYGYSARKIADMMKINRNTINGDIENWYGKIMKSSNFLEPEMQIIVNIQRFNIQRSRLRDSLDKVENFSQRHAIEKMIFDIDSKIINTQMKLANSAKRIHKLGIGYADMWLEKNGKDYRFMSFFDTVSVSEKAKERINKIIKEDRKKNKF